MVDLDDDGRAAGHYRLRTLPGGPDVFLLLCDGARVTLRSQQMRAMNLAWALRESLSKRPSVAVVRGGAAGSMFAAAAANIGKRENVGAGGRARVDLFETYSLMHPVIAIVGSAGRYELRDCDLSLIAMG
jgi:NADPH-dependent 2,4-dienoyl-CoA reductase/sulfur reductase-like enzyme